PRVQRHPVLAIPGGRVEEDVLRILAPGEHLGEQDAVVVAVGFIAADHHVELLAPTARQELLDEAGTRHSVPHHDQTLLPFHDPSPSIESLSTRAAHTLKSGIRLIGSSAGFVSWLADCDPPQWKGRNTVSSRIPPLTRMRNSALPRRVATPTESP